MNWTGQLIEFVKLNYLSMIVTFGLLMLYFISRGIIFKLIRLHASKNEIAIERQIYVRKLIHLILILLLLTILGASWEISLQGLSLYFASIFTILGVALFANWSLLSNLTASVILFFFFPFRIGHIIKIVDGDNSQEGMIIDISLFYLKIETVKKDIVVIPNNLAMQKIMIQIMNE